MTNITQHFPTPRSVSRVGIIGAGWLGLPLALSLNKHYDVWCTTSRVTRQSQIQALGINTTQWHYLHHDVSALSSELSRCDTLIITLPFKRNGEPNEYQQVIHALAKQAHEHAIPHLIFLSSTSVYQKGNHALTNTSAVDSHHGLVKAETLLLAQVKSATLLRLSGLIGPADVLATPDQARVRHPAYYLSGKVKHDGNSPVNLVHQRSIINAITHLVHTPHAGIFNLTDDDSRTKSEYYQTVCKEMNLPPVLYDNTQGQDQRKVISNFDVNQCLINEDR